MIGRKRMTFMPSGGRADRMGASQALVESSSLVVNLDLRQALFPHPKTETERVSFGRVITFRSTNTFI